MNSNTNIPAKITRMIALLHDRGYENLYLYSGMSPSGMHWRYEIGVHENDEWPSPTPILSESFIGDEYLPWTSNIDSIETMADDFVIKYAKELKEAIKENDTYKSWYRSILNKLSSDDFLVFYADYPARHEDLLNTAPNYKH